MGRDCHAARTPARSLEHALLPALTAPCRRIVRPPRLRRKFREALSPTKLNLMNQSHKHAGHTGNPTGAPDAETHFECVHRPVWRVG